MSSASSSTILSIYNSRNTIIQIMHKLNYNIEEYDVFSINEINAMFLNNQLDILLTHNTEPKKIYIKYYLNGKQIRSALDNIIEDLFEIESVLTKNDTLVIIIDEEPNETIINKIMYLYEHDGIFIVIHNIKRLQYNILNHFLIPSVDILNEQEVEKLKQKYNLNTLKQLPEISRFDPLALIVHLKPNQVIKLLRKSPTAINTEYYRVCI
jgi:DNA-directed RNA polymerase subunit H